MRIYANFTVDTAGTYQSYFEVYDQNDDLVLAIGGNPKELEDNETSNTGYITFTDLTPRTGYYVIARVLDCNSDEPIDMESAILYFTTLPQRPDDWYWWSTVSVGSPIRHTISGSMVLIQPLTANEWNAFIDRIKEFAEYKQVFLSSTYLSNATNGVDSWSPMLASQANAARYLINQLSPPTSVPSQVSSGSDITAAFINGLKNSLNSIK